MKLVTVPETIEHHYKWFDITIFLAGSIEQDTAEKWQDDIINMLEPYKIRVLNPRRKEWDPTWEQSIKNPEFKKQVEWELNGLATASYIFIYFDPNTKSPISLLELGIAGSYAQEYGTRCIVCCPDGFWRKGNIEIFCERQQVQLTHTFEEFKIEIIKCLKTYKMKE